MPVLNEDRDQARLRSRYNLVIQGHLLRMVRKERTAVIEES
jgi:hypothetical protein